jgi:hypothetical protein
MALARWVTRCIPGLSVLALLVLIESALQIFQTTFIGFTYPTGLIKRANPVVAQFIFSTYTILLHLLAFLFPLRLCRAVWCATSAIRQAQFDSGNFLPNKEKGNDGGSPRLRGSDGDDADIVHVVIIPIYKEEVETLEDALNVLASHSAARQTYNVRDMPRTLTGALHVSHTLPHAPPHALSWCVSEPLTRTTRSSLQWRSEILTQRPWQGSCSLTTSRASEAFNILCIQEALKVKLLGRVAISGGPRKRFSRSTSGNQDGRTSL